MYDANTKRFMAEDISKDGFNWYQYCANNPVRFADPTGRVYVDSSLIGDLAAAVTAADRARLIGLINNRFAPEVRVSGEYVNGLISSLGNVSASGRLGIVKGFVSMLETKQKQYEDAKKTVPVAQTEKKDPVKDSTGITYQYPGSQNIINTIPNYEPPVYMRDRILNEAEQLTALYKSGAISYTDLIFLTDNELIQYFRLSDRIKMLELVTKKSVINSTDLANIGIKKSDGTNYPSDFAAYVELAYKGSLCGMTVESMVLEYNERFRRSQNAFLAYSVFMFSVALANSTATPTFSPSSRLDMIEKDLKQYGYITPSTMGMISGGTSTSSNTSIWVYPDGSIKWPPNNGFDGKPSIETLQPGTRIDRYGSETGSFVSPEGTPYANRALPAGSEARPYNVYEVVKPIEVQSGKIAPWFDQPGGGIQYQFNKTIEELISGGFLRRLQ